MIVYLVPNLKKQHAVSVALQAIDILVQQGASIWVQDTLSDVLQSDKVQYVAHAHALAQSDIILTIGGDGTMLHIARDLIQSNHTKPILGINLGRMGFLAIVEVDELQEKLSRLVRGEYILDQRAILSIHVSGENNFTQYALNEVVVAKATVAHTVDVQVYCDDILATKYAGDGVIVATPTGSTAYSLSAGGPVLDASIAGMVLTPICAHSLRSPSMVFSAQRKLRVKISAPSERTAYLCCDGINECEISCNDEIEACYTDTNIALICFNEADQFEAIDKKLKGR